MAHYKGTSGVSDSERTSFSEIFAPSLSLLPLPTASLQLLAEIMVSIDLDNIIHYHPPPIPNPPCKPPHLPSSSRGSSHAPLHPPILIHPLPPRPPRLSSPHPRRQSPSPVTSCLPGDHDAHTGTKLAHPNEIDKELADFDMAGIDAQKTSGSCVGDSEAEDINGVQRKELDDLYGGK